MAAENPRANLEIALALAAMTSASFGTVGLASLTPFVRSEFDLSTAGVGGIMSAVFLGALAATVPAGRLTDRHVRPGLMLGFALLGLAAGLGAAAAAPSALLFFAGVVVAGLAYGSVDPATNVLVTANVSQRRRGFLMSVKQTGVTLGGILGGLILPSLANATSWRVAVVVPLAACFLVALWGFALPGTAHETIAAREPEAIRPASFAGTAFYGFVMAGVQVAILAYLAVYLVDQAAMSKRTAGLAVAVTLAGATTGRISWGVISDRFFHSRSLSLQLAAAGSVGALVLVALLGESAGVWPVLFLVGFCSIGWNGVYMAVAAESTTAGSVGRATGLALFFTYTGCFLVPPLFGLVKDGTSWDATWLIAAALVAAMLVAFAVVTRRVHARV